MVRWTARLKSLRGFMGLCGFLGDLPFWMPRGAVIGGKGLAVIGRRAFPIV